MRRRFPPDTYVFVRPVHWTSSIGELPAELLLEVFQLVKNEHFFGYWPLSMLWIKVSHVCRRWRYLAINFPKLWINIDLARPDVACEMLKRSQSLLIHLHAFLPCRNNEPSWLLLEPHMFRVAEIDLFDPDYQEVEMLGTLITPFPALRTVRIHSSNEDLFALERFLLKPSLSLRTLDIEGCTIPSPLRSFPNLVKLIINGRSQDPCNLTAQELLSSFEAMPHLEHVDLVNVLYPMGEEDSLSKQFTVVGLPRLVFLSISDDEFDAVYILNALHYPHQAKVQLACRSQNPPRPIQLSHLLEWSSRLRWREPLVNTIHVKFLYSCIELEVIDAWGSRPWQVTYYCAGEDLTKQIITAIDGLAFRSLLVDVHSLPSWWPDLLGMWPNVVKADVLLRQDEEEEDFLAPFFEGFQRAGPNLASIITGGCSVEKVASGDASPLMSLLRGRSAAGIPIKTFYIDSQFTLPDAVLKQLETFTRIIYRQCDA